jgi:hypothetical protein
MSWGSTAELFVNRVSEEDVAGKLEDVAADIEYAVNNLRYLAYSSPRKVVTDEGALEDWGTYVKREFKDNIESLEDAIAHKVQLQALKQTRDERNYRVEHLKNVCKDWIAGLEKHGYYLGEQVEKLIDRAILKCKASLTDTADELVKDDSLTVMDSERVMVLELWGAFSPKLYIMYPKRDVRITCESSGMVQVHVEKS